MTRSRTVPDDVTRDDRWVLRGSPAPSYNAHRQLGEAWACADRSGRVIGWDEDIGSRPLRRYRFPAEIIGHAVWLYFRFPLGLRMVEELLAARGIIVSHETVRQ